ncbi:MULTISPECIES: S66 peptidase family protein [Listeria]|uniref:S66 family peptidase n=1 Tax=Listeria TaxID=1637 RepID=UPI000B598475|nr:MULTISPECIES: S66 peptidase family protein [Listeria]
MLNLQKLPRLKKGDTVATISLSSGAAGDPELLGRYEVGKKRLQEHFGLKVIEMPHTLAGSDFIYHHPEKRAADLMAAFQNPDIKAIFACIGGNDSIRMLPYIDFAIIQQNPKIFIGYSDSTITHLMCLKAGISSFYGPAILSDFAENVALPTFTKNAFEQLAFHPSQALRFETAPEITGEFLPWLPENSEKPRKFVPNDSYDIIQGTNRASGPLIGGCMEVLEMAKGTALFPELAAFDDAILFLETSEVKANPWWFEDQLRNYGIMGVLSRVNGIVFGKPKEGAYQEEYHELALKVLREFHLEDIPVFANASFGHNEPKITLPYGRIAELNPAEKTFTLLESAVY